MFSGPHIKMAFSFTIISNVAITTQKFVNNMGTKFFGNAVFKSKKVTQTIFRLGNNFKDHLLLFTKYMKARHKNLKFTFDFEESNSFSFLDVKITRVSNGFSNSIFCKATFCGVFTNFDSFIFESYKTNLIFTLLFCCFTICSDMQSVHLEVEQLRQIFKCNNYPVGLIDQCVKTFLNRIYVPKRILITVPKKDVLIVLPFLGQFSLNLRSRLYNCFNKALPQCNTKVIF